MLPTQFTPLALTVSPGIDGYRVAFAGGPHFEPVDTDGDRDFPTLEAAWLAKRAAERALMDLERIR
jgi:hypothetical protein